MEEAALKALYRRAIVEQYTKRMVKLSSTTAKVVTAVAYVEAGEFWKGSF